jgi:hypothetical protein
VAGCEGKTVANPAIPKVAHTKKRIQGLLNRKQRMDNDMVDTTHFMVAFVEMPEREIMKDMHDPYSITVYTVN